MTQNQWVVNVTQELKNMRDSSSEIEQWNKHSIYRVPSSITDINKKAYKPQWVAFGPYHHGQPNLVPMEENKHRALLHFLKRYKKPFECYVEAVMEVVEDLKQAYSSLDQKWRQDTTGFVKIMILDGCFMLEMLRVATTQDGDIVDTDHADYKDDYAPNDPIFSNHGKLHIMPHLKRDMLMLKNQLPMLLLNTLVAATKENDDPNQHDVEFVNKMLQKFCSPNSPIMKMGRCLQPLDLYRKSLLWENPRHENQPVARPSYHGLITEKGDPIVRSATELYEAGIRFRKSKSRSLKGISFQDGILKLPPIMVDDATESLFLNLIAFERLHVGVGNEVTSYIFFMDVVHKQVHSYCKKPWNQWRANLIHTYFRNPWSILSVLAAVLLFALTIIQTTFTVFPRDNPTPTCNCTCQA